MSTSALNGVSLWRGAELWFRQKLARNGATTALLACLIAAGIALRIQHLGEPQSYTFDEELFVKNAHNYLVGAPDLNDHPPLGKLAMAAGMLAFGYNALGFRFASLCFGIQNVVNAYWLGRCAFRSERSGWFAAAFTAADGFFIAYSRVALLDGFLTCLVLFSVLAALTARNGRGVACAAILVGLATSVKWSGAFALFPCLLALLAERRVRWRAFLWFALVPVVHASIWMLALKLTGRPWTPLALFETMRDLFKHHVELGHRHNDLASPWYTWLVLYHPIVVKWWLHGATHHYVSSAGNPVLWFPATALALLVPLFALARRLLPLRRWLEVGVLRAIETLSLRGELLCVAGWFALLSPWIVGRGSYTFFYHYLPCHAFALVLLAGVTSRLERAFPRGVRSFTIACSLAFVYFAPVWGDFSISEQAANRRLVFHTWRP
jgi:dolichyl-phosphate-mannose--protein O-mannosyl transferase